MPSPRAAKKFANVPPPGWQREQMPRGCRGGGTWARLELIDALLISKETVGCVQQNLKF